MNAPWGLRRRIVGSVRSEPVWHERAAGAAVRAALLRAALLGLPTALAALALTMFGGGGSPQPATVPAGSSRPSVTLHAMAGRGELTITGLTQSPAGKIYELWERRSGVPRLLPTDALFAVARGGHAAVGVPGGLRGLRELLVTLEPVGGSVTPTGRALLRVTTSEALG